MHDVIVIGAGLAGTECAWQLAIRGFRVALWEMKPQEYSPAHHSPNLGELVCSNSLRGAALSTAPGLLKEPVGEIRQPRWQARTGTSTVEARAGTGEEE